MKLELSNASSVVPGTMAECVIAVSAEYASNTELITERCKMERTLYWIILPIILVLGTVSNILVLLILRNARYKSLSVCVYMRVYCVVNLLCLYLAYGLDWFTKLANLKNIDTLSDVSCRFYSFIVYVLVFTVLWLLVAMTIDRYIAFQHPIMASGLTTSFMAKVSTVIIFVGVTVVSVHALWVKEMYHGRCLPQTEVQTGELTLHTKYFSWLNAICNQYLPIFLLFVFFILLLTSTCMKTKESRTQQAELVNVIIVLNVLCLCLTLPALSAQIVNTTLSPTEHDQKMLQRIEYITQVADILAYWNHVIVWFVCVIFSGSFRNETKIMFGRLKLRFRSIRRGSHSEMKVIASGSSIQCQQEEESANTLL